MCNGFKAHSSTCDLTRDMSLLLYHLRLLILLAAFCNPARLIVVPRSFDDSSETHPESNDRTSIARGIKNDEIEREEFQRSIPCIESFLRRYTSQPAFTSFVILYEDEVRELLHVVLSSLERFAFFLHTVDVDFEIHQTASNAILLLPNASSLRENFYIVDPCDRGCPFVSILISSFEDEQSFLEQAEIVVRSMWTRRISTAVILARVADSVLAAASPSFESDKLCTPSSPVILDKCERGSWSGRLKEIKSPEMNDCILKVAYFEQPPYVITTNDSEQLLGFEGSLTEEVTKGQRIHREKVEWNDNTSYAQQVKILLYHEGMADLVIGRILQQSDDDIGYSATYDMLKIVWVVPKVPNVSLKGLVQPFHPYVWAAIGGSLILGNLVRIFLSRDLSWLDIFALIIGVSTARRPTRPSSRIQFISWSIFGLFIVQFYVDSLADQLINQSDLKIETMKELMASSFGIGGSAALASVFEQFESDEIIEKIKEKYVIFDLETYLALFNDICEGRNTSFALVTVLNSSRSDVVETAYAYTMTTDVICSFPLALATWKGLPYLRTIDYRIHDYIVYGLFDFMIKLAIAQDTRAMMFAIAQDEEYKSELHLQQFLPAFLLLIIGFSSGFVIYILEVAMYPSKVFE